MKKNLRIVLALTLGLATTAHAQDWSVDSRTRVNSTEDATSTEQRVRTAVDFGGEKVSAHVEFNTAATLGKYAADELNFDVRQAYATTNVMDFASLTAGRMALDFGNGRIMGTRDWDQYDLGSTFDGFLVGINNDFADLHLGYATSKDTTHSMFTEGYEGTSMFINAGKDMDNMSFNLFYMSRQDDIVGVDETSMGLDASYAMDNGINLTLGYYTIDDGTDSEMDLTSLGAHYQVNDGLAVHAGYDMYGENGFYSSTGSFGDMQGSGMIYSSFEGFEGTDMSFGGSYAMGDFMLGATMHNVTSEDEAVEYAVTDISLGYTLSDNSSVKVNYATSDQDAENEFTKTWISLHIGF
jgi:hypothetical protein